MKEVVNDCAFIVSGDLEDARSGNDGEMGVVMVAMKH